MLQKPRDAMGLSMIPAALIRGARAMVDYTRAEAAEAMLTKTAHLANLETHGAYLAADIIAIQDFCSVHHIVIASTGRSWTVSRANQKGFQHEDLRGRAVAGARAAADLTQKQLAEVARVSYRTVTAFENGACSTRSVSGAIKAALLSCNLSPYVDDARHGFAWSESVRGGSSVTHLDEGDHPSASVVINGIPGPYVLPDASRPAFRRFRIEILGTDPGIWREILIPENATFEDLHKTIQAIFGWADRHAHEFRLGLRIGPCPMNGIGSAADGHVIDERGVWLYDLPPDVRTFDYIYDLDGQWVHRLQGMGFETIGDRPHRPQVIGGAHAGPLEDCGSVQDYNVLADAVRRQTLTPEQIDWLQSAVPQGRGYDPDAFSNLEINTRLSDLGPDGFLIPTDWETQVPHRQKIEAALAKARLAAIA